MDNKTIIALKIQRSEKICSIGGVMYIRIGKDNRALDISEILSAAAEKVIFSPDQIVTPAPVEEVDEYVKERFLNERRRQGFQEMEWEKILKKLRLAEKDKWTLAGLLFFHPNPQEYYPHTYVRIINDEWLRIAGPIPTQIQITFAVLLEILPKVVIISEASVRDDILCYSPEALREAVINALIHRSYFIDVETLIFIKEKQIEIVNPGGFPPGVTPDFPIPNPRNRTIYELAFQMGLIEKRRSGIELMKEEARKNPYFSLQFDVSEFKTRVIFKREYPESKGKKRNSWH